MTPCVIFLMWVSGSGKATVVESSWLRNDNRFAFARSYCTRPMREWEINWKTYRFITENEFWKMMENNEFVEPNKEKYFWSAGRSIHIHWQYSYGTSLCSLMEPINQGKIVIKEIEMIGLQEIMSHKQPFVYYSVFLDVDWVHVVDRIKNRANISDEELKIRIDNCKHESLLAKQFCTHIINANQSIDQVTKDFLDFIHQTLV